LRALTRDLAGSAALDADDDADCLGSALEADFDFDFDVDALVAAALAVALSDLASAAFDEEEVEALRGR
jgi:hypothetical protein